MVLLRPSVAGRHRQANEQASDRMGPMTADDATKAKGAELLRLHQDEELLTLVNVWDVATAKVVAATDGTRALATASHSIAAAFGYPDGEKIPLDLMLEQVKRIVDSTDLPVTADLEGGYGNAPETIRRAIGLGVVGANIEDQLKPIAEAARQVEDIMKVAEGEGVDFVLNARTDAFALNRKGDPADNLAVAIERGKAYLDAGAPVVFVPAMLDEDQILALVEAFGPRKLTTIGIPGNPPRDWQQEHGVARTSYGPLSLNVALTALQELAEEVHRGGGTPANLRILA
jgi:2-methylisocitrate lyase-like PEP mutase family enzyme